MPDGLSAKGASLPQAQFDLSAAGRLKMVAMGYIPLLHVATCVSLAVFVPSGRGYVASFVAALLAIYLIPPLAARLVRPKINLTAQRYPVDSAGFLRWWYTAQWQVLFNRLPFLEELLRLVPGLYSTWLRLWGAKIGALVYWSPGLQFFDRGFLDIGDRVVIGANTKICPHLLSRSSDGVMELILAPVSIGDDSMIGGSSLLPAGVRIDRDQQTPGFKPMAPFAHFRDGQHVRTTRFHKESKNA